MNITRNEELCTGCGLCVRDCVSGVWRVVDGEPAPVDASLCNQCSHCLAVCPKGAIAHDVLDDAQAVRVNRKKIDPDSYRETVMSRRSVRNFRDREVSRETIDELLDLARYAPTASNDQNVAYTVITDRDLIRELSGRIMGAGERLYALTNKGIGKFIVRALGLRENRYLRRLDYALELKAKGRDFILHDAPAVLLVHGPGRAPFICDNCNIAAANIVNYAHALGLGTCYTGFLTLALKLRPSMRKRVGLPRGRRVFVSLVLGYPAYVHANRVSRKKAKVTWLP